MPRNCVGVLIVQLVYIWLGKNINIGVYDGRSRGRDEFRQTNNHNTLIIIIITLFVGYKVKIFGFRLLTFFNFSIF